MSRQTVLLADDHAIVLEGLRRILEPEFEVVGAVGDGRSLVDAFQVLRPDVAIVDVSMPALSGPDAVRLIRRSNPKAVIVFLSMHPDVIYAQEALNAGGAGYVLKNSAAAELLTAIRWALAGRRYVTPSLAEALASVKSEDDRGNLREVLTQRQLEILPLLAEGRTAREIAEVLHVSSRTVEFHKYRLMRQLGVRTTPELTRIAVKHHILA